MLANLWWVWGIVAAAFIIGEMFTMGFFLLWFGIGAIGAAVAAFLSLGLIWQWTVFVIVSLVLFFFSRSFADRITGKQPSGIGADRAIGQIGRVTQEISDARDTGLVRLSGDTWRAMTEHETPITVGTRVVVLSIDGTKLIVKKAPEDSDASE